MSPTAERFSAISDLRPSTSIIFDLCRMNANNRWYHWDMLKHRPTCATVKRKRVVTFQKLSTRKAKPTSLCHRQTSPPPSKKHRRNQRQESAQVSTRGAARLSHCASHFALRATLESPALGRASFDSRGPLPRNKRSKSLQFRLPLLPTWT